MVMKQEKIWTLLYKIVAAVEMGYFSPCFSANIWTSRTEIGKHPKVEIRPVDQDLLSRVHDPGPIACYNP